MYSILVAEDNKDISKIVIKYLESEGYETKLAENGLEALEWFNSKEFHLVLLDIMMPGLDGFQVLEEIRKISNVPIILLTAKNEEVDRLKGFDIGADDYVVKPFSPRELMHRVKVLLKRVYNDVTDTVVYDKLELHLKSMKLFKDKQEIILTTAEFLLLKTFIRSQGHVLTRDQLIELSFGDDYEGYDRNIDSYIKRLRQKIEDNPKKPNYIQTKYGSGYILGGDKL